MDSGKVILGKLMLVTCLLAVVPAALAQTAPSFGPNAAATGKTVTLSGKFVGTSTPTLTSGACTGVTFPKSCPSSDCSCEVVQGSFTSSGLGKGTATLSITVDEGNGGGIGISGAPGCVPAYTQVQITSSKDTETWDAIGAPAIPRYRVKTPTWQADSRSRARRYIRRVMAFTA